MPTVDFSTRAVADVGHLMRFRARRVRRGATHRWVMLAMLAGTLLVAVVPAFLPGAGDGKRALSVLTLLPVAFAAFLAVAVISAVVSGGGRELLPRDQAAPYPISPTTDHLGALLLAPVNTAWLLQAWLLLGSAAYGVGGGVGPRARPGGGPAVAAGRDVDRPGRGLDHGGGPAAPTRHRGDADAVGGAAGGRACGSTLQRPAHSAAGPHPDRLGGGRRRRRLLPGAGALTIAVEVAVAVAAIVPRGGAGPPRGTAYRPRRAPGRERDPRGPAEPPLRPAWRWSARTGPRCGARCRCGAACSVLAIGPGLVAIAGNLPWHAMTILPGLVASGGALLFGVNAWCLDGRGGLWRESLPVSPQTVFTARAIVLGEFLLIASVITIVLASLRAGIPSAPELAAIAAHAARGHGAGGRRRTALVGPTAVRRRPPLGPGHPRAAGRDGGLLDPAGGEHDAHRAGVLRPRPGPRRGRCRC